MGSRMVPIRWQDKLLRKVDWAAMELDVSRSEFVRQAALARARQLVDGTLPQVVDVAPADDEYEFGEPTAVGEPDTCEDSGHAGVITIAGLDYCERCGDLLS